MSKAAGRESHLFPEGFLWGTSTSSYQIEGATSEDGRGESIWDRFCRQPGRIANGESGELACDHYHRYREDVALMAGLGLPSYRFSIAWPRLFPEGRGPLNRAGLDFYQRLVEALLEAGIMPAATLYHWDLPQALQDRGGWLAGSTADRFGDYAAAVFEALADRVPLWFTINEPWCAGQLGHFRGVHAPGLRDLQAGLTASHNLLVAHGRAVQAFRAAGAPGTIGITLNLIPAYPADPTSAADQAATVLCDGYTNRWFLDPVLRGVYPEDLLAHFAAQVGSLDFLARDQLSSIARSDFLSVNFYSRLVVRSSPGQDLGWSVIERSPGVPATDLGWEIVPDCLVDLLLRLRADYGPLPLYIAENGAVFDDHPGPDGSVDDPRRVDYLRDHLAAARRAIEAGVDLRGYFVWSLLDNFEWAFGYGPRFGIVHVDFATQRRTPKTSARFYSEVIRRNGLLPGRD